MNGSRPQKINGKNYPKKGWFYTMATEELKGNLIK